MRAALITMGGFAAGIAVGFWLRGGSSPSLRTARLRLLLRLAGLAPRGILLRSARVPVALLDQEHAGWAVADGEGLVLCDIHVYGGIVVAIGAAGSLLRPVQAAAVDLGGCVLCAAFVDAHTHLIKTHTAPRNPNPTGSINGAIACEMDDLPRWAEHGDVSRRLDFALRSAWHHGTRLIRTHLDGCAAPDPRVRAAVYAAYAEKRLEWRPRGLELQGVANLFLPLYRDREVARAHAAEAKRFHGVCLGAYCGHVTAEQFAETEDAFDSLFEQAMEHGLDVDLHIDETNDPAACGLMPCCAALGRARAAGFRGHVLLGHATSLSLQPQQIRVKVIAELQRLGPVTVVCNPYTNLALQDRRGTAPPAGLKVDEATARTPQWRGLTLVQELREANIPVAAASDNVRDWWYAYGSDYDCVAVWALAMAVGHLETAPSAGHWADLVCVNPATALQAQPPALVVGSPADLVLFSCRRLTELFSRPQHDRIVLRKGLVQVSVLPAFSEIDDLVAMRTQRISCS